MTTKDETVSIIIINRNGERFLSGCIESVKNQSYNKIEIILIDNVSTDKSLSFVKENHEDVTIIANSNNEGYSKAANTGILKSKGEYILILNPDVILDLKFIENCLTAIKRDEKIGSVSGKLLRFRTDDSHDFIDSTGLILCQDIRRPLDRGQNQRDNGQYDKEEYIFGVNGAAPFYRRAMLEDVKIGNEYFDEDFFAYYEDVDIAWRAQLLGWKCYYTPFAVAYHYRSYLKAEKGNSGGIHAVKNRYLLYLKNEFTVSFLKHILRILFIEAIRFLRYFFREKDALIGVKAVCTYILPTLKKRAFIMKKIRVNRKYMESWYVSCSHEIISLNQ
ncbi:MAG: glycosyltransferase family 2 protein [Nitrospinae bacterium]|nr:glycosyltransferase family 2 protein [Nitrospinota bacterium]